MGQNITAKNKLRRRRLYLKRRKEREKAARLAAQAQKQAQKKGG